MFALLLAAATAASVPYYPDPFSTQFAAALARDRTDTTLGSVSVMALSQLQMAAPRVCPDLERERMWAIAMRLTNAEKIVMASLCLTFSDGQAAAMKELRKDR